MAPDGRALMKPVARAAGAALGSVVAGPLGHATGYILGGRIGEILGPPVTKLVEKLGESAA
jgi:hypothetical protein